MYLLIRLLRRKVLPHNTCRVSDNQEVMTYECDTCNIETRDKYNNSPIHMACIFGHLSEVKDRHEQGCDIESPGNFGSRPLHLAAKYGWLEIVKYLCSHQCQLDVVLENFWTPIHLACRHGHTEIVRHLCEKGCNKELLTYREERPLHLACMHGHLEIVMLLCEWNCDYEASTSDNYIPLHLACKNGHLEIVRYLCEQGCDIEAPTWDNYRPLHLACMNGHLDIVRHLCEQGCDIEAPTSDNYRPIHLACSQGQTAIVEYLCKQQKCNIEALDKFGYRPIHVTVLNRHFDIIRYLCQQRCEIEAVTKTGESVLDLAIQSGRRDIHRFLFHRSHILQLMEKISKMKVECDVACDHSSCFQSIYSIRSMIARGGFGAVFKIKDPQLNYTFCMKSIYMDPNASNQTTKHIEFNLKKYLHILHHERIVQYFGMINSDEKVLIFMEYVEGTSLDKRINKKPLPHNKVIQYSKEILEGLKFLHQNKIIHRDIKPQNILFDTEDHIKLCDFGLSCYLESIGQRSQIQTAKSSSKMTFCGTPNYMAPECVTGQKYSYPVDIWSLGASVVEMLTGVRPLNEMEHYAVLFHIGTMQKIEFIPAEPMSEDMKSFVDQMLCPCPSSRATAEQLLKFIDDVIDID